MIYGIIPARLESTRLPRKMLLAETGKPLIQHTWEAAKRCRALDEVIIATDNWSIEWEVERFGGRVERTGEHSSGTSRVAEVAAKLTDADIIVNIQGDEPELNPADIDRLVWSALASQSRHVFTLAAPLQYGEMDAENVVKVLCGNDDRAIDFAREVKRLKTLWMHHVGVYAFRRECLLRLAALPVHREEVERRLEQMRWLCNGFAIGAVRVDEASRGIDTIEDYCRFVERVGNAGIDFKGVRTLQHGPCKA